MHILKSRKKNLPAFLVFLDINEAYCASTNTAAGAEAGGFIS